MVSGACNQKVLLTVLLFFNVIAVLAVFRVLVVLQGLSEGELDIFKQPWQKSLCL